MTDAPPTEPTVLIERAGRALVFTLNRPKSLNALDAGMIALIDPALTAAASDPDIDCVIIEGAGGRAFCAGGDVRACALSLKEPGSTFARDYFRAEYSLNRRIHRFPKPYISLIDGISMGGGLGLSVHGSHRVVTERLVCAMPETGIGLFPDIGGGWFLPRWPGFTGRYVALTGARLSAADALYVGYATSIVASADLPALRARLIDRAPKTRDEANRIISDFTTAPSLSSLAAERDAIDRWFQPDTIEGIILALASDGSSRALEIAEGLGTRSPTSLKVALRLLQLGVNLSIEEDLALEYRASQHAMAAPDFAEGIRAVLIEKDNRPVWQPAALDQVTLEAVEKFFSPSPWPDLRFD
jgi:enoyl-CoA hydratase